jgi:hypothetical protein
VLAPVISSPNIGFLVAALLILFGLVFYYPFVYRKIELKIISKKKTDYVIVIFIRCFLFFFRKTQSFFDIIFPVTTSTSEDLMVETTVFIRSYINYKYTKDYLNMLMILIFL